MRVLCALIVLAISVVSVDVIAARPGQAESASLSGTASDATGRALSNTGVQLRNISTGQLASSATTNALGQFSFLNLPAGTYLAEVINAAGQIVATSAAVDVSSGWAITGVGVTAPAAAPSSWVRRPQVVWRVASRWRAAPPARRNNVRCEVECEAICFRDDLRCSFAEHDRLRPNSEQTVEPVELERNSNDAVSAG